METRKFRIIMIIVMLATFLLSVPFAFAGDPAGGENVDLDYGDLPPEFNNTTAEDKGAVHIITDIWLGDTVDADDNGQQSTMADGDDTDAAGDDEDGIVPIGNWNDGDIEMNVFVTGGMGCLYGWIDWHDGNSEPGIPDYDFDDLFEQVLNGVSVSPGMNTLTDIPFVTGVFGQQALYARFRLVPDVNANGICTDQENVDPDGLAEGGEVEDYLISFTPTAITLQDVSAQQNENLLTIFIVLGLAGISIGGLILLNSRGRLSAVRQEEENS